MAKMFVKIEMSYGEGLLVESKDAQLLAEIVDRATVIKYAYASELGDYAKVIVPGKQKLTAELVDTTKLRSEAQLEADIQAAKDNPQ